MAELPHLDANLPFGDLIYWGGTAATGFIDLGINYGPQLPGLLNSAGNAIVDQINYEYWLYSTSAGHAQLYNFYVQPFVNIYNEASQQASQVAQQLQDVGNKMPDPPDPDELYRILKELYEKKVDQIHHWINQANINKHSICKAAEKTGLNLKKWNENLSKIPHQGGHVRKYYDYVSKQLDAVQRAYQQSGGNWTKAEFEQAFKQVIINIKNAVQSGQLKLYK